MRPWETPQQTHRRLREEMAATLRHGAPWPQQTPRRLALHEAGHAVLAAAVGVPIERVSIVRDGNRAGHVALSHSHPMARVGRAAIFWAGAIAEDSWLGAAVDLQTIRDLAPVWLTSAAPNTPFELAHAVLRQQWAAVQLLAAELVEHGTLTGEQLAALA